MSSGDQWHSGREAELTAAGPTVVGTVLKHYLGPRKDKEDADGDDTARVEFMYDEG